MNPIEGIEHLQEIHQSNNSVVFRGTDIHTGNLLAVKVLNEEYPSPHIIARFNEEAEISQRFSIKGLRKVFEKRKINNRHALVMEYIEGRSLHEWIGLKAFHLADFLKIAIHTTEILSQIHKNGIIHKDINPKNLLVQDENKVFLIDLGLATVAKKEHQKLQAPDKLEGTLAYISPEQTGRMNHAIDARSDLYSLGITFYEMLTGVLPFQSTDSMELVHSHIAKIPESPKHRNPKIPPILDKIVMKLIEKDIYKRYQTALGLRLDLEYCLGVLNQKGEELFWSLDFELAHNDVDSQFQIPEKLYGRETERALFLQAFDRTQKGAVELLLVSGYSGIGKTALIRELYKPVTERKAYFISGKFEQFQRDIPYSAFISAINGFIQQLLGESESRLRNWREEIIQALGNNAGVMTEVVPNLEHIIGSQKASTPLSPLENQNRFNSVLQKFFRDLSTKGHPFVLFVDDWQWADLPSLHLLKLLTTDVENQFLLFIAAYRDNEVDDSHPFMMSLSEIQKTAAILTEVKIKELEEIHIIQMLADTLKESDEKVKPLADLIKKKTSGNPFFVSQFLQNLYDGGHIEYDYTQRQWAWDHQKIQLLPISTNVLDLMTLRIQTLPSESQKLLQLAACIGNHFPVKLLSELSGKSQIVTRQYLLEALEQGLVVPYQGEHYAIEDDTDKGVYFRFLHDRVEQAAYQMLDKEVFAANQWKIGQIILEKRSETYIRENLFDLVNYLNKGREYAKTDAEKIQLAELNYEAGKRAKRSTAYSAAYHFLGLAIEYFTEQLWETDFEKAFDLHKELGENQFLNGKFEESDQALGLCLEKAKTNFHKAEIYKIKIAQFSGRGKYSEAVEIAFESAKMFGIYVPNLNETSQIQELTGSEINEYLAFVNEHGLDALDKLPECKEKSIITVMELLGMALDCAAIGVPSVLGLLAMKMNNLTIKQGLSDFSSSCYIFTAVVYGAGFKDFKKAYQMGDLACKLAENRQETKNLPKVYHLFAYFAYLSPRSLEQACEYDQKAYEKGVEVGDFVYASYGIAVTPRFYFPISIDKGLEKSNQAIIFLQKINNLPMVLTVKSYIGFGYMMKDFTII
jgi:predicted ATPase/predicted Ser/Thr protein kinase